MILNRHNIHIKESLKDKLKQNIHFNITKLYIPLLCVWSDGFAFGSSMSIFYFTIKCPWFSSKVICTMVEMHTRKRVFFTRFLPGTGSQHTRFFHTRFGYPNTRFLQPVWTGSYPTRNRVRTGKYASLHHGIKHTSKRSTFFCQDYPSGFWNSPS